jgi:ferredoxin
LEGNDTIEDRLLYFEIQAETGKRDFTSVKEGITFAQVAALNPRYADHFLVIPPEAWDDNQVEMAEYLEEFATSIPKAVPFIWLINPEKELCRAIVSREMSSACYDRLLSWQNLQELGGLNNEYVQRAVSKVRKEMEDKIAQREKDVEEKARKAGAESAIDRLVALFSDPSTLPAVTKTEVPLPPKELPEEEKTKVEKQETEIIEITEEPETGEEALSEDPYIDSFLCSSCNDCINLNPLMFKYNGDNQAYIADPSAGTFLQLVKAAEACPAKCIHPGTPQPGDETATPEVLDRAKALM